jgi:hypothetical protein
MPVKGGALTGSLFTHGLSLTMLYILICFSKVFIHNPHTGTSSGQGGRVTTSHDNDMSILNINQQVSAVAVGKLTTTNCDTLLVGTPTNLLAYDVENNSDLFYKDVSRSSVFGYQMKHCFLCLIITCTHN